MDRLIIATPTPKRLEFLQRNQDFIKYIASPMFKKTISYMEHIVKLPRAPT
jgi:hypothetical protein